jgi:hypothetical protein
LGRDVNAAELRAEGVLRDVLHLLHSPNVLHLGAGRLEEILGGQLRPPDCKWGRGGGGGDSKGIGSLTTVHMCEH